MADNWGNWDWDAINNADQPYAAAGTTIPSYTDDFDQYLISYPLSHISKSNYESGNKIIMPPSALHHLASLPDDVVYPMLFRLENTTTGHHSHCGVIEFTADEGLVFLPTWMMSNMQLQEGDLVRIQNTSLPKGTYIKIQPHDTKFTTLSDHKSLLEKTFGDGFACLTTGDTIVVNHEGVKYMIDIVETKPSPAVLLFETDCEVEFAPPLDYKEPEKFKTTAKFEDRRNVTAADDEEDKVKMDDSKSNLFPGAGRRLGGISGTHVQGDDRNNCLLSSADDLSMKKLKITESETVVDEKLEDKDEIKFKAFAGVGRRADGKSPAEVVKETVKQDQAKVEEDVKIKEDRFNAFSGRSYRLL